MCDYTQHLQELVNSFSDTLHIGTQKKQKTGAGVFAFPFPLPQIDTEETKKQGTKKEAKKRKRDTEDPSKRYYVQAREVDRQRWSAFTYPLPGSVIVIRVDNMQDGCNVRIDGRLSHTILGMVDEVIEVTPTSIRIKGRYIDIENPIYKDDVMVRVDDLPFKEYGYYKFWYVRNIPVRFQTDTSSSKSDPVQARFLGDLADTERNVVHVDSQILPFASRKKKNGQENMMVCDV